MTYEPTGPVIAGVDGSAATAVVDLAAREAMAHGTPLVLLHVGEPAGSHSLDALLSSTRRRFPGCATTVELATGDPAEVLAARSADASAVVLGHDGHPRRRTGDRRRDSVTLRVLAQAKAPVLVCRPSDPAQPRPPALPVLVGIDDTPGAEAAVEFGFEQAALRGAPLLAVQVCPSADAAALVGRWAATFPQVPVRILDRPGIDAAIALTAASRSAQLAVIAADPRVGVGEVAPNSTLAAFVDRAACPVAVVHAPLLQSAA